MNEPKDQAIGTPSECHCSTLREIVSIVHAEMVSACRRSEVAYGHVYRWRTLLREGLGNEYTDSSWLRSIGFIKDATSDNYRLKNWFVLKCESGKWQAYSVKSSHWHYLCDVDRREDVMRLVAALKLSA